MGKGVIKSGLVLKPILEVDAIPIALTLKQYFTFALDLVHKVLRGGGGGVHFWELTLWAGTISILWHESKHDQKKKKI